MPTGLDRPDLIRSVRCTDEDLVVTLKDGRTVSVPLWWYPRLLKATPAQRAAFEIGRSRRPSEGDHKDIELARPARRRKAPDAKAPVEA